MLLKISNSLSSKSSFCLFNSNLNFSIIRSNKSNSYFTSSKSTNSIFITKNISFVLITNMKPTTIRTWFPMKIIFDRSNTTINNMSLFSTRYIKIRISSVRISNNVNPSILSFDKILVFNSRSSFSNSKFFYIRSS